MNFIRLKGKILTTKNTKGTKEKKEKITTEARKYGGAEKKKKNYPQITQISQI